MNKLTPPDALQCQAEVPNGNTFMTLGGQPGRTRCTKPPTVIATEKSPGNDGQIGCMSMCTECFIVYCGMGGYSKANFREITRPSWNHAFTIGFSMVSANKGEGVTGRELRTALEKRLKELDDDELIEACGMP